MSWLCLSYFLNIPHCHDRRILIEFSFFQQKEWELNQNTKKTKNTSKWRNKNDHKKWEWGVSGILLRKRKKTNQIASCQERRKLHVPPQVKRDRNSTNSGHAFWLYHPLQKDEINRREKSDETIEYTRWKSSSDRQSNYDMILETANKFQIRSNPFHVQESSSKEL